MKRAASNKGIAKLQLLQYVSLHAGGGCSREGHQRYAGDRLADGLEAAVGGAKIVSPLGDAVGLAAEKNDKVKEPDSACGPLRTSSMATRSSDCIDGSFLTKRGGQGLTLQAEA